MMMASDIAVDLPRSPMLRIDSRYSLYLYQNVGKSVPSWLLIACEHSGNGFFWILGTLVLLIWPSVSWKLRIFAINLEVGFLLDLLIIGVIKLVVKRTRPAYAEKQYHATIIADKYSFPSGHASRCVFIAAMIFVFRAMCHRVLVLAAVLWAMGITLSRVFLGRHYVTDVVTGSFIGVAIAAILSKVRGLCKAQRKLSSLDPCL
jgi:presqualene diphosphate phosphatase